MNPAIRFISNQHWAIVPSVFDSLLQIVERHDAGIRATQEQIRAAQTLRPAAGMFGMDGEVGGEPVMQIRGDTAVIPIRGVLARYADQVNGACQDQGRSAESIQSDLARASANPSVSRIILRIDSPGGTVAGTAETGMAIRAASEAGKHVIAYVDGLAASAAYWLASQADEIVASAAGSLVGSIGVITAMVDATKAQEKQGYRVHVVRSVSLKAPGTANESLTPEQLASVEKVITDLHSQFTAAVMSGRSMDQAAMDRAATGEVFTAADGIGMGLVDRISDWAALMADQSRTRGTDATQKQDSAVKSASTAIAPEHAKESHMAKSLEQAAALAEKHPAHAGMILALAAKDHTEEQILAAIKAKDDEAAKAKADAELAGLKASVADLTAKLDAANKANGEKDATIVELTAKANAISAHKQGGDAGNKIKGDGEEAKQERISQDAYDAMPPKAKAEFHQRGGVVA